MAGALPYGGQPFNDMPLNTPTYLGGSPSRQGLQGYPVSTPYGNSPGGLFPDSGGRIPASFSSSALPGAAMSPQGVAQAPRVGHTISVQALNELEASVQALRSEVYGQRMAQAADEAREARIRSVLLAEEADKKEWEAYHLRSSLGLDAVPPQTGSPTGNIPMSPTGNIPYGMGMKLNGSNVSVGPGTVGMAPSGSMGPGMVGMAASGQGHQSGINALSQQVAALCNELKEDRPPAFMSKAPVPQGSGNVQADMDTLESVLEEVREAKLACRLLAENVVTSQRELMKARSERSARGDAPGPSPGKFITPTGMRGIALPGVK